MPTRDGPQLAIKLGMPYLRDVELGKIAERAKSVAITGAHVQVGLLNHTCVVNRHLVDVTGNLLMRAQDAAGPCLNHLLEGAPPPTLTVSIDDVSPVPQPDRLRARLQMHAQLDRIELHNSPEALEYLGTAEGEPLVRLRPESLTFTDLTGQNREPQTVDLAVYRRARPDPLAGWETQWVSELDRSDPDLIWLLASARTAVLEEDRVRLLGADAHGIDLRIYREHSVQHLRLAFQRPARCACQARMAFDELVNHNL